MNPPRRNDPCPCGSGKKYKKCCLAIHSQPPPLSDETDQVLTQAFKEMSVRNWDKAASLFKSVENNGKAALAVLQAIAGCYEGMEDFLKAAEYYEKALSACTDLRRLQLTYQLGVARACAGRFEKAESAFHECLALDPSPEQKQRIEDLIRTLLEIRKGNQNPHLFLVNVMLQRAFSDVDEERYQSAADLLERILLLDPENPAIFYNLGVVYTFLKRDDEALESYEAALRLNPNYVQAWYNMGQICLIKNRDFSRALHCFDRALALRPDYVGAHHQRGVVWELLGDPQKAVECWEKTLDLDPENKSAKEGIERLRGSCP